MDGHPPRKPPQELPPPPHIRLFPHQVSGQAGLLLEGCSTVLKPGSSRERGFYEAVPRGLAPFTARFRGTVRLGLSAERARRLHSLAQREGPQEGPQEGAAEDAQPTFSPAQGNPWGLSRQRGLLQRLAHAHRQGWCLEMLRLENLVQGYRLPCVLDLKMGTVQSGPWASVEKQRRKAGRAQATTSGRFGLRLINKQVGLAGTGLLVPSSKEHGRSLSVGQLAAEIQAFVRPAAPRPRLSPAGGAGQTELSAELSVDLSAAFVGQVERLHAAVQGLDGHRFFCSSLLLLYDGARPSQRNARLRLIDFAQWAGPVGPGPASDEAKAGDGEPAAFLGPDAGLLLGLENLIRILGGRPPSHTDHSDHEE